MNPEVVKPICLAAIIITLLLCITKCEMEGQKLAWESENLKIKSEQNP